VEEIVSSIAGLPDVEYAEPDLIMLPALAPTDPQYGSQWHYFETYGVNATAAWDITTGSDGIKIAVIDTGITDHADLAGRWAGGYDFITDVPTANDGNGRDSDPHDPGDWITSSESASGPFAGCGVTNSTWHGTHVAGTIGAASNNDIGVAGVNWVSKIVPVRVLGKCGGFTSDIADGMRWAAGLPASGVPANPNPAKVLNLSLGGPGVCSATYQNAIDAINAAGSVVVVAAGNNGSNLNSNSFQPANCNGVITVAAIDRGGQRAYYSNYGATVEISAPGGETTPTLQNGVFSTLNAGTTSPSADTYGYKAGTSMAAPHVSGVISLMLSLDPGLSFTQILQILQSTARMFPVGSSCTTSICGSGIVDAGSALNAVGLPDPPDSFNKSSPSNGATNQSINPTLQWGSSNGATTYEYCYDTSNDNACLGWTNNGSATSAPLGGLSAGATYYWHVRAINAGGTTYSNGSTTAFWSFTTATNPPGAFNKTSPSNGATEQSTSPTLQWGSSSDAASYEYCYDTSNDNACSTWTSNGASTNKGLSGLSAGTTYYWHVRAINTGGTTYSNGSATAFWTFTTAANPPGAFNKSSPPDGATNQPTSLTLSWGSSSGVTTYEYCLDTTLNDSCNATWTSNGTSTSKALTGLSAGASYEWHVRAVNSGGTTYSNVSATAFWAFTTAFNPPSAFNKSSPANGAINQSTNALLSWGSSAGATSYQYCYATTTGCTTWTSVGTNTSVALSGLSNNQTYYWQVRAVNAGGNTQANSGTYWSFTTVVGAPGAFNKTSPADGATGQSTSPTLQWGSSSGASSYEYCYDTSNDNACSTWTTNGTSTSKALSGLSAGTTYYWHVRAVNASGTTYSNGSTTAFWSFTTTNSTSSNVEVYIGSTSQGSYPILPGSSTEVSYNLNSGPVRVTRTGAQNIISSQRVTWGTGFDELMGYPANQLTNEYVFPWYNNKAMSSQLRIGNTGDVAADVDVYIGGTKMNTTPYNIAVGGSVRVEYAGVNNGPVRVVTTTSGATILATMRVIWGAGYDELMGYPANRLTNEYVFPFYNNKAMSSQLRIGNTGTVAADVDVYIGGTKMNTTPYNIAVGGSQRVEYAGINNGPVRVVTTTSGATILATMRVLWGAGYDELMGYPADQLTDEYVFPMFTSTSLDTQLRIGNTGNVVASVDVYLGNTKLNDPAYSIAVGGNLRLNYAGKNAGPLRVVTTTPGASILATERLIKGSGYDELMGYPANRLTTEYLFPWYNNKAMQSVITIAAP
jgi:serine protease